MTFQINSQVENPEHFTVNGLRHYWTIYNTVGSKYEGPHAQTFGTTATHERFYEMPLSDINLNIIGPTIIKHCGIEQQLKTKNDKQPPRLYTMR